VVKHVDAVELRVVAAEVLAVAADAVLVAKHLLKLAAHLATALARLHVHSHERRSSLEAGRTREKKGGEERRKVRNSVWYFRTGNKKCRWRARVYPKREIKAILSLLSLELRAPCKARLVWGREIFASATCSLQFAKASAAMLSQQEENNSEDVQRGGVNISGFIGTVASKLSRWCLYRWRLRHKTSASASGGPAGGRRVAECLGRWHAVHCISTARHAVFNDHIFAGSLS
jgi:hypothetical protein